MTWIQSLTAVDIVLLGILILAIAIGWTRGLVQVLTGFLTFAVATVVAGQYTDNLVAWLNRTWSLQERLASVFARQLRLPAEAGQTHLGKVSWQKALEWLQGVPIPESYRQTLAHRLTNWSATAGTQTAADYIVRELAAGILNTVVFLILVALLGSLLGVLGALISDQVKGLPIVGTTNSLLGAVVTGIEAAVLISLLVALVVPVLSMYGLASLGRTVESARLTPYCVTLYSWLRGVLFGLAKGSFFVS